MNIIIPLHWKEGVDLKNIRSLFEEKGYKINKIKFKNAPIDFISEERRPDKKWFLICVYDADFNMNFVLCSEKEYKKKYPIEEKLLIEEKLPIEVNKIFLKQK